jgi:glycosyltransferase involved in cell wall biosynthesis
MMSPAAAEDRGGAQTEPEAIDFTLLMPCLNEAETVSTCVGKAIGALGRLGLSGEVLVADNGSTDGSQALAQAHGARVVQVAEKGYGSALRAGINAARGRFVIMGDADDSYDWSQLDGIVAGLRGGADLVMGCRLPRGGGTVLPEAMPPLHRWLGNPGLSWLGRLFFGSKVTDFYCGLRGFRRDRMLALDLRSTGMEYALEQVVRCTLAGYEISQVPVTLHPDGRSREPHLRTWVDGWRSLRFFLLYSPRWLFLYPGLALFTLGMIGLLSLATGTVWIGRVGLDLNTQLVASLAALVGSQLVFFGLGARVFAVAEGLLPPDPKLYRLFSWLTLEKGVLAGLGSVVGGMAMIASVFARWVGVGFGGLDLSSTVRIVAAGAVLTALGVQLVFGSFFISLLGIRRATSVDTEVVAVDPPATASGGAR